MKRNNDKLKWLLENFNYIDSVTAIDNTGKIIVKQRHNPRYSDEENMIDNQWAVGKNLLEVFPSLNHEDSSLMQSISTGKVIYCEKQETWNHVGRRVVTNNITFPMVSRGKIIGAIEISRDVTHLDSHVKKKEDSVVRQKKGNGAKYTINDIVTNNDAMRKIKKTIMQVANSPSAVLVYGETGTGKELVVSALHNSSYRRNKPFVPVNCAALPENLLEGLLFGSRKGAFTGAENKKGLFEEADGGTIYLDEINSMPIALQAKLLRVLQEKTVMPLGESRSIPVDVRVIASTNQPLDELLASKTMREDLLYRLNTISIDIPPLRKRAEDVPILAEHFIRKYNEEFEKDVKGITDSAMNFLVGNDWKGNVRELEHAVEAAMNMVESGERISLEQLPAYLTMKEPKLSLDQRPYGNMEVSLSEAMENYERQLIILALSQSGWKIVDAARRLQIPRTSLQYKMNKYNIKKTEFSHK